MELTTVLAIVSPIAVVLGFAFQIGRSREMQDRFTRSHQRHYDLTDEHEKKLHDLDTRLAVLEDRNER